MPPLAAHQLEGCGNMREAHMKTCPDCNGDGVVEKRTDDERNAQRAVAVVSYVTTTAMKK